MILYGFYDFTTAQKKLFRACSETLDVVAFMPWRNSAGFGYASSTLQWYQDLGFKVKAIEGPVTEGNNSLQLLQRHLFQEKGEETPATNDGAVRMIAAPSEAQEVREIAREILRFALSGQVLFQ